MYLAAAVECSSNMLVVGGLKFDHATVKNISAAIYTTTSGASAAAEPANSQSIYLSIDASCERSYADELTRSERYECEVLHSLRKNNIFMIPKKRRKHSSRLRSRL